MKGHIQTIPYYHLPKLNLATQRRDQHTTIIILGNQTNLPILDLKPRNILLLVRAAGREHFGIALIRGQKPPFVLQRVDLDVAEIHGRHQLRQRVVHGVCGSLAFHPLGDGCGNDFRCEWCFDDHVRVEELLDPRDVELGCRVEVFLEDLQVGFGHFDGEERDSSRNTGVK